MVDPSAQETAALHAAMRPVGEVMEEIGWQVRLADLTQAQVLTLIEVAVGAFQEAMQEAAPCVVPEDFS